VPPGKKPAPAACVFDPLKSITGPSILPQVQEDLLLRKRGFVSDPKICFDHIIDLSPLSRKFWPDQNFFILTKKDEVVKSLILATEVTEGLEKSLYF
jgi:hypothetical protein